MSRIANAPVVVPKGVDIALNGARVTVKGPKGSLEHDVHESVEVVREEAELKCRVRNGSPNAMALAGTTRALINNMVTGVSQGFERKLTLVGVGYRAQLKGSTLSLSLGFSHPVEYAVPDGIEVEAPTPTEVIVRGMDKQKVGQTAAEIRAFRPPEPYKGKGVKYSDEQIVRKEAKKK